MPCGDAQAIERFLQRAHVKPVYFDCVTEARADRGGLAGAGYFAYSTARVSRMTVTLI